MEEGEEGREGRREERKEGGEGRGGEGEGMRGCWQRCSCCELFELSLWLNLYLRGDQHIFWSKAAVCDSLCVEVGQCL